MASSPYVQSSSRFLKVLSQSHGFSHHFLLPRVGVFTFLPYRKQRKHRLSLLAHSRLATNLHPHPSVLSVASTEGLGGWCPAEVLGSEGLTGLESAGPYRRLEVMSKQVIIMRWALQKLTRLSRRSVTPSSASRYSRESSCRTCSKSTERERSSWRWDSYL